MNEKTPKMDYTDDIILEEVINKKTSIKIRYTTICVLLNGDYKPIYDVLIIRDNKVFLTTGLLTRISDEELKYILMFREAHIKASRRFGHIEHILLEGTIKNCAYVTGYSDNTDNSLNATDINDNIQISKNNNVVFVGPDYFSPQDPDEAGMDGAVNCGIRIKESNFFNKTSLTIDEERKLLTNGMLRLCQYFYENEKKKMYIMSIKTFEQGFGYMFYVRYTDCFLFAERHQTDYNTLYLFIDLDDYEKFKDSIINSIK